MTGASIRQGPHHSAQKSTTSVFFASSAARNAAVSIALTILFLLLVCFLCIQHLDDLDAEAAAPESSLSAAQTAKKTDGQPRKAEERGIQLLLETLRAPR